LALEIKTFKYKFMTKTEIGSRDSIEMYDKDGKKLFLLYTITKSG